MSAPPSAGPTDRALLNCADEPIAVPGAIQPHGVLLALAEPDLTVVSAGHRPVLHVRPGGSCYVEGERGRALGLVEGSRYLRSWPRPARTTSRWWV